ncbi:ATP-binding protein [Rhizobium sp. YIM 134829]|uniref:ATP-binding protein n=1 Tax=Rhizobium sp. YIM 134829 TaxID=3390453 RepID=UPI003978A3D1
MARLLALSASTILGQITGLVLICLVIVLFAGSTLERWVKQDYNAPDVEELSERVTTLAIMLSSATDEERRLIVDVANRSGFKLQLRPLSIAESFTTSSPNERLVHVVLDWIFPPDNGVVPLGGWRTFWEGKRVLAAQVDKEQMLILEDLPEGFLRSDALSFGSNYLVALVTLILLFSLFAVWAITRPLRRIASAAASVDLSLGTAPFEEQGSVEIVALARALNGMQRRISIMADSRTRMLRGISHDLRTPLTRLRLRAERIPQNEIRDPLLGDIERIDHLLNESLSYMRDGHEQEAVQRADLASVLQTVCAEFSDMGHDIAYDGPAKLILSFKPLSMMRAVTNLCDNASKFGTRVEVALRTLGSEVVIEVADNGPGIGPEHRSRVMEPFYKADTARGGTIAGFGLGLSIVAEIVHSHRGRIDLLDREPNGLRVRITLPG